jgi:phosphotransferase system IIB component
MTEKVNVKAIKRNAISMVAQSSGLLVLQVVTGNAVSKAVAILQREGSDLGAKV